MEPSIAVIVATFNERETLPELTRKIEATLPDAAILVVDDSSPDGTGEWALEKAGACDNFHVLIRENERGLGSATLAGINWAMKNNYEFIATLDADLSHDPNVLNDFCQEFENDTSLGVVIGSRYIDGGAIEGWPIRRRAISHGTNWLSRRWLRLGTRDNTSAFRMYRVKELQKICLDEIKSNGYGYLQEILFRLKKQKVSMVEVPILFRNRELGQSKTSIREGLNVIFQILTIRFRIRR